MSNLLLRPASSLPKGSAERKAIPTGLEVADGDGGGMYGNRLKKAAWGGGVSKHEAPRGRIWLARLGGLSPVKQNPSAAPVRRGYWAFLWPYIELFLAGSTDDRGIVHSVDPETGGRVQRRPSRLELHKQKKLHLRKFQYEGWLWTRFPSAARYAVEQKGYWYRVDAGTMSDLVRAEVHSLRGEAAQQGYGLKGPLPYDMDTMEVFVPATGGRTVGRPGVEPDEDDADRVASVGQFRLPGQSPSEEHPMSNLRSRLIRLAHSNPELRADILPVLKESAGLPPRFPEFEIRFGEGRGFTMLTDPPGYTRGDAQAVKNKAVEIFEATVRPILEREGYLIGSARLNQARPGEITWEVRRPDPSVDEMVREIAAAVRSHR